MDQPGAGLVAAVRGAAKACGTVKSAGQRIKDLREERGLRPADIHRISEAIKRQKNCPGFGITHASLNDIENHHSVPSVRKMFSLACV
jgi:hypothetical protein